MANWEYIGFLSPQKPSGVFPLPSSLDPNEPGPDANVAAVSSSNNNNNLLLCLGIDVLSLDIIQQLEAARLSKQVSHISTLAQNIAADLFEM